MIARRSNPSNLYQPTHRRANGYCHLNSRLPGFLDVERRHQPTVSQRAASLEVSGENHDGSRDKQDVDETSELMPAPNPGFHSSRRMKVIVVNVIRVRSWS